MGKATMAKAHSQGQDIPHMQVVKANAAPMGTQLRPRHAGLLK